jgi:uncharacterized iron-regulated protein
VKLNEGMFRRLILFAFVLFNFFISLSQKDIAFAIYNSSGRQVSYSKLKKNLSNKSFVFFGEFHDNPISHWLEFEITQELFSLYGEKLKLGFEMFETDQQSLLSDFVLGNIDEKSFKDSARLWVNYKTDYKPLVDFAKQENLYCMASNIPRIYANRLYRQGRTSLDSLSDREKSYMAPLDFEVDTTLSQYANLLQMAAHMGAGFSFVEAQAIKDATMAHFLFGNRKSDETFIHFNGAYHTDFYQGIIWYLRKKDPNAKILTISTVSQEKVNKLESEHFGKADFIICVDQNMTSTH